MRKDAKQKKHIMIVDDNSDILNTLGIVMTELGFTTTLVEDSRNVLAEINKKKPDLIFLDLIMQHMDGEEVLRVLKKDIKFNKIPVILLSASNTIEDVALNNDVAGFIKKPFDLDNLDSIISKILY